MQTPQNSKITPLLQTNPKSFRLRERSYKLAFYWNHRFFKETLEFLGEMIAKPFYLLKSISLRKSFL
ncbi:hypothetical protein OUK_0255 [Helicobacter pylori R037c]|nr:hypothetical protein OUK_0255 [Helicobacter pylori R037c]